MKTRADVTADKLRGGFYTPPALVAHGVARLRGLLAGAQSQLRILEPASGDGAFIRGLSGGLFPPHRVVAVDVDADAAAATRDTLRELDVEGTVREQSALRWSLESSDWFDAAIGNLPFVRFQFLSDQDKKDALVHGDDLGVPVKGVANLWLPMMLASLRRVRPGGAFAFVLPAEFFTGVSASAAREWLLDNVSNLTCDIYPAGSFPNVLQEVVLLSGMICPPSSSKKRTVTVVTHDTQYSSVSFDPGAGRSVTHDMPVDATSWTHLFLEPEQVEAFAYLRAQPGIVDLGQVVRFEVAAVTGANSFFSLRPSEVRRRNLEDWARPLLARVRQAPGLIYSEEDLETNVAGDGVCYMFDAGLAPTPRDRHRGLDQYLNEGEQDGLHTRYKTRIRDPWWAVPHIKRGELLLSKRCHFFPRAIVNETEAVTTDTIYRGRLVDDRVTARDVVATFHSSLTLLSAELEGRNFGGGVLELVPSEVARLSQVLAPGAGEELPRVDEIYRSGADVEKDLDAAEEIVRETDLVITKRSELSIDWSCLELVSEARQRLQSRRLQRTDRAAAKP